MSESDGFAGLTMEFETVVGDKLPVALRGVYGTPDGKYTFLTVDGTRYRSVPDLDPNTIPDIGWRNGETALVTLTFNTAGRVIAIERNG